LDFNESHEKMIQGVTTAAVGLLAWEYTATQKWAIAGQPVQPYSLFTKQRFGDALAGIIGNQAAAKIFPGWGGAATFHPNPMGFLNQTFFTGIGLGILDALLSENKFYSNIPALSSVVKGAAYGAAFGGALGGIFDPDPKARAVDGTGRTPPTMYAPMAAYANQVTALNASWTRSS